jgi:AcrR family transcriptional regulator
VPRAGLDRERVVGAAADLADAEGLGAVTLARVAAGLGVRAPSLYHHVAGRDDLVARVALRAVRELGAALRTAATGRAGPEALSAVARAHRDYARAHPGRYATTVAVPAHADPALRAAAGDAVEVLLAVVRHWDLDGDEAVHAVRGIRSAVHGFVALEAAGGFGLALDRDASFDRLVATLTAGLPARDPVGSG